MKKSFLSLLCLAAISGLAACGGDAPSSVPSTPSVESVPSVQSTPSEESTPSTPSEAPSSDPSSDPVPQGPLAFGELEGLSMPNIAYEEGLYTITLIDGVKTGASVSGSFNGMIKIDQPEGAVSAKSFELELRGLTLTYDGGDSAIYYTSADSKLIVSAKKDTENAITYSGSKVKKACIGSENNIEVKGKGTLNLSSTGRAIKCDDLSLTSGTKIAVASAANGAFVGNNLIATDFSGSINIDAISGAAFQFEHDNAGSITLPAAELNVSIASCDTLFVADSSFTIPAATSIAVTSEAAFVSNVGAADITVTVEGNVTIAGNPVATQVVSPAA